MGQTAKGHIGLASELIEIQRLDLHIASALKSGKDLLYRAALFRQRRQIYKLGLAVAQDYFY
jgi:hypothetical protein